MRDDDRAARVAELCHNGYARSPSAEDRVVLHAIDRYAKMAWWCLASAVHRHLKSARSSAGCTRHMVQTASSSADAHPDAVEEDVRIALAQTPLPLPLERALDLPASSSGSAGRRRWRAGHRAVFINVGGLVSATAGPTSAGEAWAPRRWYSSRGARRRARQQQHQSPRGPPQSASRALHVRRARRGVVVIPRARARFRVLLR